MVRSRVMATRWGQIGAVAVAGLCALRLAACSGGDEEAAPTDGTDGGDTEAGAGSSGGEPPETPESDAAGPAAPPSYCEGLTFYASFDQGIAQEVGTANPRATGAAGIGGGKYGAGLAFVEADAAAPADGGMVFYDRVDGGAPFFSAREGTLAFWFRRRGPARSPQVSFVRPVASLQSLNPAGPATAQTSPAPGTGLFDMLGGQELAALTDAELAPFVRVGEFNHVVTGWRAPSDGGAPGYALAVVNGGLGEVLTDAGARDAARDDTTPDDAGNVRAPFYQRSARATFPAYPALASVRLGGIPTTVPVGDMDDFAVWNRELTAAEMAALYKSPTSIRAACKLP